MNGHNPIKYLRHPYCLFIHEVMWAPRFGRCLRCGAFLLRGA